MHGANPGWPHGDIAGGQPVASGAGHSSSSHPSGASEASLASAAGASVARATSSKVAAPSDPVPFGSLSVSPQALAAASTSSRATPLSAFEVIAPML